MCDSSVLHHFVVSIPRRHDRRTRLAAHLEAAGVPFEFTSDWAQTYDGRLFHTSPPSNVDLFPWQLPGSSNRWWNRPLRWGEVACSLNHLGAWEVAAERGLTVAIILEDDIVLLNSYLVHLRQALLDVSGVDNEWDLLYLGRMRLQDDKPTGLPGIVKPGYSFCAYGYALSNRGLSKLLSVRLREAIIPVDEFLPALFMDHPRPDVRIRYCPCLNAYALHEDIVFQLPKDYWGSDTEESLDVHP